MDQGHTFVMMIEKFKMTENDISKSVGKSIGYISQHISLVSLYKDLTEAVETNKISFSQARELMRIDDHTERTRLLKFCQNEGATVRVLQNWVQDFLRESSSPPSQESQPTEQIYDYNDPHTSRFCEACGKSVEISKIRQVFYCPPCHHAIKIAISEENQNISPETTQKTPPEAPQ